MNLQKSFFHFIKDNFCGVGTHMGESKINKNLKLVTEAQFEIGIERHAVVCLVFLIELGAMPY